MPPKARFSKEEIVSMALQITREHGIGAVTARELGARLGSSARPIFTVFQNMEEVNDEVVKAARLLYGQYINKGLQSQPAFRGVGIAYVQFAMQEPKLFQLLFMNEQDEISDMEHVLIQIDENYEEILKSVEESYQLEKKIAEKLYRHLWIYTHGIASLCATKVCRFTVEEIENMLIEVFTGLYEKVKRDGNSNFS